MSLEELQIISATFLDIFHGADLWLNGEIEYKPLIGPVARPPSSGEPRARLT